MDNPGPDGVLAAEWNTFREQATKLSDSSASALLSQLQVVLYDVERFLKYPILAHGKGVQEINQCIVLSR